MTRLQEGNIQAFEEIYERYCRLLYVFLYRILHSRERAEDCLQCVFMSLWEKSRSYKYPMPFKPWIYKIAYNRALNELKKIKIRNIFSETFLQHVNDSGCENTAIAKMESEQNVEQVKKAVDSLPDKQRMMIILREYEEVEFEDISRISGYGVGSIKYQIGKAYESLERKLKYMRGDVHHE